MSIFHVQQPRSITLHLDANGNSNKLNVSGRCIRLDDSWAPYVNVKLEGGSSFRLYRGLGDTVDVQQVIIGINSPYPFDVVSVTYGDFVLGSGPVPQGQVAAFTASGSMAFFPGVGTPSYRMALGTGLPAGYQMGIQRIRLQSFLGAAAAAKSVEFNLNLYASETNPGETSVFAISRDNVPGGLLSNLAGIAQQAVKVSTYTPGGSGITVWQEQGTLPLLGTDPPSPAIVREWSPELWLPSTKPGTLDSLPVALLSAIQWPAPGVAPVTVEAWFSVDFLIRYNPPQVAS